MIREKVEWTNGWHEDAGNIDKRRWLLIGDSVARQYRGRLQELVQHKDIAIDFFATSYHIADPAFFKELQHFFSFEEYKYEMICINWGAHHGFSQADLNNQSDYHLYKTHYENLLTYILKAQLYTPPPLCCSHKYHARSAPQRSQHIQ